MNKLFEYYSKRDLKLMKKLVMDQNFDDFDEKDKYGVTVFNYACKSDEIEIVELFINAPNFKSINKKDNDMTPFISACLYGCVKTAKLLMKAPGFNSLNESDHAGRTALHWASWKGYTEIVKLLINNPETDINIKHIFGQTAFHFACQNGYNDIVKLFINAPKFNSLNEKDINKKTPLDYTLNSDVVEELLKRPDIIIPNNFKSKSEYINKLIELFKMDPKRTRTKLQLKETIDVYRLIVFLSDGYFVLNKNTENNNGYHFMNIACQLPLELQMLLIRRLTGLSGNNIFTELFNDKLQNFVNRFVYIKN